MSDISQQNEQEESTSIELHSSQPAVRQSWQPQTLRQMITLAQLLAKSDLIPTDYQGKPQNIMLAIMHGASVGFSPAQALQGIAVIAGRPALWGAHALAVARRCPAWDESRFDEHFTVSGKRLTEEEIDALKALPRQDIPDSLTAVCVVGRKGSPNVIRRSFSVAEAKNALVYERGRQIPLWDKSGVWQAYPIRMLQMRARGYALRDAFPDALHGLFLAEELVGTEVTVDLPEPIPAGQGEESTATVNAEPTPDDLLERGLKALSEIPPEHFTPGADGNTGIVLVIGAYKGQPKTDTLNEDRLRSIREKCDDPRIRKNAIIGLQRRVEALEQFVERLRLQKEGDSE